VVIREDALSAETLGAQITAVLGDPDHAVQMAAAALACGLPDATERLAGLVRALAAGREG